MIPPNDASVDEREDDLENQLNRTSMWAVTYGNLMGCLMLFFLVLFVASATRGGGSQAAAEAAERSFGTASRAIEDLFSRYGAQKIAGVEISRTKARIVLAGRALFDPGSASLKSDALPMLQEIFEILDGIPNTIRIEGHTDDRPLLPGSMFDSNSELSSARASAILRYFDISGISEGRLSAIGYGDLRPVKSNDDPEGRAANQRVEIVILRRPN